jgi:predicted MFS family arabinose efflux permease
VFAPVMSIAIFSGAILALRPVFAREILDVGASGLGWLSAAFGLGSLLGSLIVIGLGERMRLKGLVLLISALDWCVCMVFYAISPWFVADLFLELMLGMAAPFWTTASMTLLQVRVPEQLRSRVLAAFFMLMQLLQLNWLFTGLLADAIGDREALFIMGLIPTGLIVVMLIVLRPLVTMGSARNPLVPYEILPDGVAATRT